MNFCPVCAIEIPEGSDYCSSECRRDAMNFIYREIVDQDESYDKKERRKVWESKEWVPTEKRPENLVKDSRKKP